MLTGKLIVQYEDANGEQYTQELELPLEVAEPQPEQKEEPVMQAAATVPPVNNTSDNTTPPADDTPKTGGISKASFGASAAWLHSALAAV